MDYYAIGQRIRKYRRAQDLSQEQLAEKIYISAAHMSHIETGNTKLSLPVLVDLAAALGVRANDLLYDEDDHTRAAALAGIIQTLDTCTTQQLRIMEDILRASKVSLDKHL